jgi:hypothetical protein
VQNTEIFHFFHEFCERGEMILETGGILDEGRKAWALATLQEGFTLKGGDSCHRPSCFLAIAVMVVLFVLNSRLFVWSVLTLSLLLSVAVILLAVSFG